MNTGIYDNSYVLNMYVYAKNSISNYNTITEIPSGHLPTDINTSLARNWAIAFNCCYRLTSFPDPFYNTSNATNICRIFGECSRIITVPNFDTSNVTDMSEMFYMCSNLTTIPNFDTSNVINTYNMFASCFNLTTVPNFNTSNVTNMSWMFGSCYNLTTIPNFDTSNVIDIGYMFANCYNLTTAPNFDTSNVTNMQQIFYGCNNLTTSPNFDTSKVTNMHSTFSSCYNLITIPTFDTSNMTNISFMYRRCYNIRGDLYIESNNVIDATSLFSNSSKYVKNIYCYANTTTYNTIYKAMRNNTYNSNWNAYLLTMEDSYAEIRWNGEGIYRFPTNKILIIDSFSENKVIEVSPYTDYNLSYNYALKPGDIVAEPDIGYIDHNGVDWGVRTNDYIGTTFRFFKDITNMTADIVDII